MSRSIPPAGVLLQIEAAATLIVAGIVLRWLEWPTVIRLVSRVPGRPELCGQARSSVRARVKSAIFQVWRRFPSTNRCVHRALAAQWMLRRRGVSTTLCYGARTVAAHGLTGHVWVMDGTVGVVGHDASRSYPLLARHSQEGAESLARRSRFD